MPAVSYTTSRPWDDIIDQPFPMPESFLKTLIIMKDTTIFGVCLGFVYAISLLIVVVITALAGFSPSKRETINQYGPILLTAPFWASVLITSSKYTAETALASLRLPFMEAVFWSMVAWAIFISGFAIIATLICLVRLSRTKDAMDEFGKLEDFCDGDETSDCDACEKQFEEATPLTLAEALAITSPALPPPSFPVRSSESPCIPTRPRIGSITQCWH